MVRRRRSEFREGCRMTTSSSASGAEVPTERDLGVSILNALPHPVIMLDQEGQGLLGQRRGAEFLPVERRRARPAFASALRAVRQSASSTRRAGARARLIGERVPGRRRHAAQRRRARRRYLCRPGVRPSRPCGDHAARAHHGRQDGQAAHPPWCRPFRHRSRRHAGARDQEPAVRHPWCGAASGAGGR